MKRWKITLEGQGYPREWFGNGKEDQGVWVRSLQHPLYEDTLNELGEVLDSIEDDRDAANARADALQAELDAVMAMLEAEITKGFSSKLREKLREDKGASSLVNARDLHARALAIVAGKETT